MMLSTTVLLAFIGTFCKAWATKRDGASKCKSCFMLLEFWFLLAAHIVTRVCMCRHGTLHKKFRVSTFESRLPVTRIYKSCRRTHAHRRIQNLQQPPPLYWLRQVRRF
jgi:hypothetical protein